MANLPELPPAARDRVIQVLTRHYANDDLSDAELESRLERVYAATALAELDAIIADLPALPGAESRALRAEPEVDTRVRAFCSGLERKVTGVVPRNVKVRSWLGYVELDLSEATFEAGVTTIDVRSFMGYVQIRLPPGVKVESAGRALFGYFALRGREGGTVDSRSVVRITGRAVMGYAEGV